MKKEEVYQQIGLEIRRLREAAGLSQLELATRVGFKSATGISLIESADRRVSLSDLQEIAEALHVRIEHFFDSAVGKVTDLEATLRDDQNLTPREKDTLIAFYNYLKDRHSRGWRSAERRGSYAMTSNLNVSNSDQALTGDSALSQQCWIVSVLLVLSASTCSRHTCCNISCCDFDTRGLTVRKYKRRNLHKTAMLPAGNSVCVRAVANDAKLNTCLPAPTIELCDCGHRQLIADLISFSEALSWGA